MRTDRVIFAHLPFSSPFLSILLLLLLLFPQSYQRPSLFVNDEAGCFFSYCSVNWGILAILDNVQIGHVWHASVSCDTYFWLIYPQPIALWIRTITQLLTSFLFRYSSFSLKIVAFSLFNLHKYNSCYLSYLSYLVTLVK